MNGAQICALCSYIQAVHCLHKCIWIKRWILFHFSKLMKQAQLLLHSPVILKQKLKMVDTVIRPGIAYSFYVVPYSIPTITKLDKKIISLQKAICGLPKSTPNITTKLPHDQYGLAAHSLKTEYLNCIGKQLRNALNDLGRLGTIYKGLTNHIFAKYGGA